MRTRSLLILAVVASTTLATAHQVGFYVTENGKTYHKQDCRTIKGKKVHQVTTDEAKRHKLKACKICKPS